MGDGGNKSGLSCVYSNSSCFNRKKRCISVCHVTTVLNGGK